MALLIKSGIAAVAQTREALVSEPPTCCVLLADRDASLAEVSAELTRRQAVARK